MSHWKFWDIAAAAAKSLQPCLTLCDPIDGSPPGSSIHGVFQVRVLEWVAIAFSMKYSKMLEWWHQLTSKHCQFHSVAQSCQTLQTPWTAAHQTSLSIINSQSLLKLMSTESVMLSNHLILCCPLLLLPSIFPRIRVFSNESVLHIRWPKYWSFSFSISPSNEYVDWSPLIWTGWISLQSKRLSRVSSNTTVQKHQFFSAQLSL